MLQSTEEALEKLREEFPSIFDGDEIPISLLMKEIVFCDEYDKNVVRCVLFEKIGNVIGRRAKLLKLFNKLGFE